jgi:GT2 family glycosyltransferase
MDRAFVLYRNDEKITNDVKVERIAKDDLNSNNLPPELSIIIPTADGYRNGAFPDLLNQLSQQTFKDFETIVIKGDKRQGRAINTGIDFARGTYIVTLDDDTSLQSRDALALLVKVIKDDDQIGIAGGLNVIPPDASKFVKRAMQELPRRSSPLINKIADSDLAEHPLMIMRKDIFMHIGGENELVPRGLDPYLREAYRKAGYRVVVVPDVQYSHLPPPSLPKLIKQFFRNGKLAAYCNKYYPQWIIETANNHGPFESRVSLHRRLTRFPFRLARAIREKKVIWFLSEVSYAAGFIRFFIFPKKHA